VDLWLGVATIGCLVVCVIKETPHDYPPVKEGKREMDFKRHEPEIVHMGRMREGEMETMAEYNISLAKENDALKKRVEEISKELTVQMDRIILDLSDKAGKQLQRAEQAEKRVELKHNALLTAQDQIRELKKRVEDQDKWIKKLAIDNDKQQKRAEQAEAYAKDLNDELDELRENVEQAEAREDKCWVHIERKVTDMKRLKESVGEVLDGTLPYLAEQRLKKALEEFGEK
jgi:chromosome segregation ATPase